MDTKQQSQRCVLMTNTAVKVPSFYFKFLCSNQALPRRTLRKKKTLLSRIYNQESISKITELTKLYQGLSSKENPVTENECEVLCGDFHHPRITISHGMPKFHKLFEIFPTFPAIVSSYSFITCCRYSQKRTFAAMDLQSSTWISTKKKMHKHVLGIQKQTKISEIRNLSSVS